MLPRFAPGVTDGAVTEQQGCAAGDIMAQSRCSCRCPPVARAVADLQGAGADGRAAAIGVGAGQRGETRTILISPPLPLMAPPIIMA